MKMNNPGESLVRIIAGGLLWGVSATLTVMLFLSFSAGDWTRGIVLVLLAIGLEGAKILTWREGGRHRFLAWVLLGVSGLASFGSALQTVRLTDRLYKVQVEVEEVSAMLISRSTKELGDVDRQIAGLESRLEALPPTWLSWYRSLSADLDHLRAMRRELVNSESEGFQAVGVAQSVTEPTVFYEISEFTGWNRRGLELVVLLILAVCLEWGALVLLGSGMRAPKAVKVTRKVYDPGQPEVFFRKMVELRDGVYLGGRDRVGNALGWPSYQVKKSFQELVKSGRIRKDGERMVRGEG